MFKFFKTHQTNQSESDTSRFMDSMLVADAPVTNKQLGTQALELTRVVLRDTLRVNGIPLDWMSCEISLRPTKKAERGLRITLVVNRWHEGLAMYAPLIQQQLLQGMQRFAPASDHSHHVVSWRFLPDYGYPHTSMPPADFWRDQPGGSADKSNTESNAPYPSHTPNSFAATVPAYFRPSAAAGKPKFDLPTSSHDRSHQHDDFSPTLPIVYTDDNK